MKWFGLAIVVALGMAFPVNAVEQESSDAAEGVQRLTAANRIICRRFPPPVGTRIGSRNICLTQMQWERYDEEVRATLDEAFNRSKGF